MTDTKTVMVDNVEYKINVLPPSKAIKLLTKLTKLIGKPMASMASGSSEEERSKLIPMAVGALTESLDEDQTLNLVQQLMTCVTKENQMLKFEQEFQGRLGVLLKLCKEVLEVNYSDFLGEISALMDG